jgi:hypothetical protein
MLKPLHIQLLEKLETAGIGKPIDVYEFVKKNFSVRIDKKNVNQEINTAICNAPILFLEDLINREVIDSENEHNPVWIFEVDKNYFVPTCVNPDNTINTLSFYLTSKGLDYLDQYNNNRLSRNANRAIIISLIVTILVSAVTVILTTFNYNLSKDSFNYTKKNDSTLKIVEAKLDTLSKKPPKH